jgi:hypothetical protein
MGFIFDKDFLDLSIRRCITATFPDKPDWHIDNDMKKPFIKDWEGAREDYSMFESYEIFETEIDKAIFWRATIQGVKTVGCTIRGTYNAMGWALNCCYEKEEENELNDTPFGEKTSTGVAVHEGFHFGMMQIRDAWHKYLTAAIADGYTTVIVDGHSRGAAIATGVVVDVQYTFNEKKQLLKKEDIYPILWAAPRYFNDAGIKSYNKRCPNSISAINANDPVTKVPSDSMGFFPVDKMFHVGFDFWAVISPTNWLSGFLEWQPIPPVKMGGTVFRMISAADHYPNRYRKNMAEFIKQQGGILKLA